MKTIILGYMASGKSTLGKLLSQSVNLPFIDLDEYIEKKEEKTIADIFSGEGEIYFRLKEHEYLKELLKLEDDFIIALGGGTPCYSGNMDIINDSINTQSVYLKASIHEIANRLENELEKRPIVANIQKEDLHEFIAKHLFERSFYYEKAKHTISISGKSKENIIEEMETLLF